jgi:hypothetical protein
MDPAMAKKADVDHTRKRQRALDKLAKSAFRDIAALTPEQRAKLDPRTFAKKAAELKKARSSIDRALFPELASKAAPVVAQNSAAWIKDDLQRMQAEGQIPGSPRISSVAEHLAKRMATAKERGKVGAALKAKSIENLLRHQALWPLPPKATSR